jgi:cellulose synthase/poly-beta-1,6-N-acetylglucosamine synthase-like glycosyltransferase
MDIPGTPSVTAADAVSLDAAFIRLSPRLRPRRPPLSSHGVHLTVLALTLTVLGGAFFFHGMLVWSAGLAFIAYDTFLLLFVASKTLVLRSPIVRPDATLPSLTMGVVVAAYNEATVLERTIESLLAQEVPPDVILIADDGSTDATAALLADCYGFPVPHRNGIAITSPRHACLRWLRAPHGGKACTLNRALPQLGTDLIVTVDADTLLAPDALAQMRLAFAAEPKLVAASGVLSPVCDPSPTGKVLQWFQTYEYVRNFMARFAWMRADSLLLISGAFAAFRSKALLAVGGFDPECLVEDYEVIHRLYRHSAEQGLDWRVRVVGRALARTSAPSTLPGFFRQRRRWFAGFLQTQYWNRDMTGNRKFGKLGTLMLPVKTVDTVQPFCGITALLGLLLLAVGHRTGELHSVLTVIAIKLSLDLAFNTWWIFLYRRWTHQPKSPRLIPALAATLLEPLLFQPLRHIGALLGWYHFLTGRRHWEQQQRHAMT